MSGLGYTFYPLLAVAVVVNVGATSASGCEVLRILIFEYASTQLESCNENNNKGEQWSILVHVHTKRTAASATAPGVYLLDLYTIGS